MMKRFTQPYIYTATLRRVIDGDTIEVDMDLGCGVYITERVRFYGLNAPEINTISGHDATSFVEANLAHAGNAMLLCTHKDRREKYGRLLANVFVNLDNVVQCLNVLLLDNKYAELFLVPSSDYFLRVVANDRKRIQEYVL